MTHNAKWIEAAQDNFQTALEQEDVAMAKAIIADAFDAGFPAEARNMSLQLRHANLPPQ